MFATVDVSKTIKETRLRYTSSGTTYRRFSFDQSRDRASQSADIQKLAIKAALILGSNIFGHKVSDSGCSRPAKWLRAMRY